MNKDQDCVNITVYKNPNNKFQPGYNQKFLATHDDREHKYSRTNDACGDINRMSDAQNYLAQCSYNADLNQLYRLGFSHVNDVDKKVDSPDWDRRRIDHPTCSYSASMKYTPIQIKLNNTTKRIFRAKDQKKVEELTPEEWRAETKKDKYLIQVWDSKGKRVFQKVVLKQITQWAICNQYFIFKYDGDEEEFKDYFQIHDLSKKNCLTLVRDFTNDFDNPKEDHTGNSPYIYFLYYDEKFLAANSTHIRVAFISISDCDNMTLRYNIAAEDINSITLCNSAENSVFETEVVEEGNEDEFKFQRQKVHGLALVEKDNLPGPKIQNPDGNIKKEMMILVFLEIWKDKQISINQLEIKSEELKPYKFDYSLIEWRQYVSREQTDDGIAQYQFVFTETNTHVGVAKRMSGAFDIYYNGNFIGGSQDSYGRTQTCLNFMVTFDRIIFLMESPKEKRTLRHNKSFENSEAWLGSVLEPEYFFTEKIKKSVKLYTDILMIETSVFVAHGKYITQFGMSHNADIFLERVNSKLEATEKNLQYGEYFEFSDEILTMFQITKKKKNPSKQSYSIGVLVCSGQIYILNSETPSDPGSWAIDRDFTGIKIPGKVISYTGDPSMYKLNLFLAEVPVTNSDELTDLNGLNKEGNQSEQPTKLRKEKSVVEDTKLRKEKSVIEAHKDGNPSGKGKEKRKEVRAYAFTNALYDITDQLAEQGIKKIGPGDSLLGMFENFQDPLDNDRSHFMYIRKPEGRQQIVRRIWIFRAVTQTNKGKGGQRDKDLIKVQKKKGLAIQSAAGSNPAGLPFGQNTITRILVRNGFDPIKDSKSAVWDDVKQNFPILTAIISDETLLIFTNTNCYRLPKSKTDLFATEEAKLMPELFWRAFYISDSKHVYAITDPTKKSQSVGLNYFDLHRFYDSKQEVGKKYKNYSIWLQYAQPGICSGVGYGASAGRLVYLKSYGSLEIIPSLHLNQISLIGQPNSEKVLSVRQIADALYIVSNQEDKGVMQTFFTTWDILTGKRIAQVPLISRKNRQKLREIRKRLSENQVDCIENEQYAEEQLLDEENTEIIKEYEIYKLAFGDLTKYERYKTQLTDMYMTGLYSKTLLISKEKKRDFEETDYEAYFQAEDLESKVSKQTNYIKSPYDKKALHYFLLIKIDSISTQKKSALSNKVKDGQIEEQQVQILYKFKHPKYECEQCLYFSEKGDYMVEWLTHNRVFLYKKEIIEYKYGQDDEICVFPEISWQFVRKMTLMVDNYDESNYLPFLSPDFMSFLDYTPEKTYNIYATLTEELKYKIPGHFMYYEIHPIEAINKFTWVNNDQIKIINDEGMENILDLTTDFALINYSQTDNYNPDEEKGWQFYLERKQLAPSSVSERLIRTCQKYKSAINMKDVSHSASSKLNLYENLFSVDFFSSRKEEVPFFSDLSFSFVSWRTIEQLEKGEISVDKLDTDSIKIVNFTILPKFEHVLHKLGGKPESIEQLFQSSLTNAQNINSFKYSIPYIIDIRSRGPIDLYFANEEWTEIEICLKYLKTYGIDHHSRLLYKILPNLINSDLTGFLEYIHSRSVQTKTVMVFQREQIADSKTPGIGVADLWTLESEIRSVLFAQIEEEQDKKEQSEKTELTVQYVDIPFLHEFSGDGTRFMRELAISKDLAIFDQEIIQQIINFQWPAIQAQIIYYLFLPSLCFLVSNVLYTSFIIHDRIYNPSNQEKWLQSRVLEELVVVFSLYFLVNELIQLKDSGLSYFSSVWNFVDFLPPFIMLSIIFAQLQGHLDDFTGESGQTRISLYAIAMSVSSFLLWFKFLYFLRIFESTGFLVRALIECFWDIRYFFLILLIVLSAFADAQKVMGLANTGDAMFVDSFKPSLEMIYMITLGEFPELEEWGDIGWYFPKGLFFFQTLIVQIIMLNLLIAIVSESFDKINSNARLASFREKAALIDDNRHLISSQTEANWCKKGKYLVYAQEVEPTDFNEDSLEGSVRALGQKQKVFEDKVCIKIDRLEGFIKSQFERIKNQEEKAAKEEKQELAPENDEDEDEKDGKALGQQADQQAQQVQQVQKIKKALAPAQKSALNPMQFSQGFDVFRPLKLIDLDQAQILACDDEDKSKMKSGLGIFRPKNNLKKETCRKLLMNSEDPHDKWAIPQLDGVWFRVILDKTVKVRGYGLKSANDRLDRSPLAWTIHVSQSDPAQEADWEECHEVSFEENIFDKYWQNNVFVLPNGEVEVRQILFSCTKNQGAENEFQLGQFFLYS